MTSEFITAFGLLLDAVGPEVVLEMCTQLFSSVRTVMVFMDFYDHEELDVHHLVYQHGYDDSAVHRAFHRLMKLGLIKVVRRSQRSGGGGQRTTVWSLKDD